ncbi:MAG: exo-alpha-sialidase, partial [Gammaproteobacteria bacterium]|nr:exo-alpha-sialidase [Gammaproteobacteria bacterium]
MIFFLKNTFSIFFLICLSFKLAIAEIPSTIVFKAGEDGYKVFRIPAIVLAANGDLLAFCEARQGDDANETDLILKRSFDSGRNWGKIEI